MTLSEAAKILNVSESATPEHVYKAYKQLAKKKHFNRSLMKNIAIVFMNFLPYNNV